ncbi:hypothetical protein [Flagellimonas aurea]|mgnify:CR=1 FL=1|uniref:STAS domain-containing protein n=1 Tax=Flagellimonas aurea TaxID=2915619 RepID=A0ABS3G8Z0_9FLAO|nr:hypothetical protein [Allomuricauda aurea]MBO0355880.1 hypothetical protein [Allomuricauda aurea]UBZ14538.1 hypothetical protein LDL77_02205 [Allomuricauda aquimarina]
MDDFVLRIDNDLSSHEAVLERCTAMVEYFKSNPGAKILIDFRGLNFIYPDYSLLVLCAMKYLESLGITVTGRIRFSKNSGGLEYLSQMGFFKHLEVNIPHSLRNKKPNSFVSIQQYTSENQIEVLEELMGVVKANVPIDDNVFASLDYCFNEILDNVLLHSNVGQGWVVGQYFPNMNALRLIVCDYGMGICASLNEVYDFTEEQALIKCVEKGVTSGKGQGHGLYATSRFIELNQGWMSIFSGNSKLDVNEHSTEVTQIPFWQGTCVYLRINTNIEVDYKQFTGEHYDYKEHLFEKMFSDKE